MRSFLQRHRHACWITILAGLSILYLGLFVHAQQAAETPVLSQAVGAVQETAAAAKGHEGFQYFAFMTSSHFSQGEKVSLWICLGVAIAEIGRAHV